MGQTLSEPVTTKVSDQGCDERLYYGVSSMQGWRVSMEDAHSAVLNMAPGSGKHISWFAVFDGHGGDRVAKYAGEHVHQIVRKQAAFEKGDYVKALEDGFVATDTALMDDRHYEDEPSGCTATAALVTDANVLYVANAGDSRTVLGRKGHAIALSKDHKPYEESEKARITAAGGYVDFGRVNGNLALSRAIGDFDFKRSKELDPKDQIVTSFPDVKENELDDWDEFVVLACDGIWDCLTNAQVVEFVRRGIAERQELHRICENLMDNCLAPTSDGGGYGCDNMTVIIVALLNGKSKDQWYDMVVERVANKDGPVAPKKFAHFYGPGVNDYMRWSGQDDGSGDEDPNADPAKRGANNPRKPSSGAADDEEGWTDWKNGEDVRKRFIRKTPGRIIHLGDGSELFTDRGGKFHEDDDEDEDTSDGEQQEGGRKGLSSSDEEEDEDDIAHSAAGGGKMIVDGVAPPGPLPNLAEKGRPLSPAPERHQSPFPQTIPPPPSPRQY